MDTGDKRKLYQAMRSRDPRYDGRFFIGVKTTGIYCRPICPAKPKFENVEFYRSQAEAEKSGFRPCLRCRPELSPLSPQWKGTAAILPRALNLIEKMEEDGSLEKVADLLGMTDRHLRRIFQEHLGASPIEIAVSKRLHLARQLLSQTSLPITEIAFASGFGSLRRFNDAFLKTYKSPPRDFRKQAQPASGEDLVVRLPYTAPYDWEQLLGFFRRHEVTGVEFCDESSYARQFKTAKGPGFYRIANDEKKSELKVEIQVSDLSDLRPLVETIRRQFDLSHNPHVLNWPRSPSLKGAAAVRVPGAFDPFEAAVGIVLGQLVSTEQGKLNVAKLVEKYGENTSSPHPRLSRLFPSPKILRKADFAGLGFTKARSEAIRELSRRVDNGELDLSASCDLAATKEKLRSIPGIGPWTTEMIALRCLGDADAFPGTDLIVRRAVEKFGLQAERFSPWRSYLALALWKTQAQELSKKKRRIL